PRDLVFPSMSKSGRRFAKRTLAGFRDSGAGTTGSLVRGGADRLPRRLRGKPYAHRRNEALDLRAGTLDLTALLLQMVAQIAGRHAGHGIVEAPLDTVFAPQHMGCTGQFEIPTDTHPPVGLQRPPRSQQAATTLGMAARRQHALGKIIGD